MNASITNVPGITVGCAQDMEGLSGCTVILTGPEGAVCSVDVRGAAPGSRETDLLDPVNMIQRVHGVMLSGGSAFGLDAAGGVMQYLEEQGIGHEAGPLRVPIVPAAVLFDLPVGDPKCRPDRAMGYLAASRAGSDVPEGNAGAGTGATVGKVKGYKYCTKSGQGSWAVTTSGGLIVGALVAVNAFGDVLEPGSGRVIAGVRDEDGSFLSSAELYKELMVDPWKFSGTNTTIAVIATNARLDKGMARRVAMSGHDGLARVINPVHTMYDGDTVFTLATGEMEGDITLVGQLAAEVLAVAVVRAVKAASSIQGMRSLHDKI